MNAELEIRKRIGGRGRITFAEFMDLALYWPDGGYYNNPDNIGPHGDFYTAPTAHPTFGALVCLQLYQMWRLMDCPSPFWVVEPGAGAGRLCHDLADYAGYLPDSFGRDLRYVCLDRAPPVGFEGRLQPHHRPAVDRVACNGLPLRGVKGCIISNELVDSFPVHRLVVREGALLEVYVTLSRGALVEELGPLSTPALAHRLESLGIALPEGATAEVNLAMEPWVKDLASTLKAGFVITVDYGHTAQELYSPARSRGTLASYHRHIRTDSPYKRIGSQDMTAHVDFTSLMEAGRRWGLDTVGLTTQRELLNNLGLRRLVGRLLSQGLGQREVDANRMAMLDLVRPAGMGGFRVLVQGKDVRPAELWGLAPSSELDPLLEALPLPLLTPGHMPLLEARYPHLASSWQELWPSGESDEEVRIEE